MARQRQRSEASKVNLFFICIQQIVYFHQQKIVSALQTRVTWNTDITCKTWGYIQVKNKSKNVHKQIVTVINLAGLIIGKLLYAVQANSRVNSPRQDQASPLPGSRGNTPMTLTSDRYITDDEEVLDTHSTDIIFILTRH